MDQSDMSKSQLTDTGITKTSRGEVSKSTAIKSRELHINMRLIKKHNEKNTDKGDKK